MYFTHFHMKSIDSEQNTLYIPRVHLHKCHKAIHPSIQGFLFFQEKFFSLLLILYAAKSTNKFEATSGNKTELLFFKKVCFWSNVP